jgi:sarcosine oxidase subunit delta
MLLIRCPYCDKDLPEVEFRHAGEAHLVRPSNIAEMNEEDFEALAFIRQNPKGLVFERWRHVHGCGRFFNAARDTVSDKFLTTYKAGEPKPALKGAR